jgi:hypothetical protein
MSSVRIRVAQSDWCASRNVVSVIRTRGFPVATAFLASVFFTIIPMSPKAGTSIAFSPLFFNPDYRVILILNFQFAKIFEITLTVTPNRITLFSSLFKRG